MWKEQVEKECSSFVRLRCVCVHVLVCERVYDLCWHGYRITEVELVLLGEFRGSALNRHITLCVCVCVFVCVCVLHISS